MDTQKLDLIKDIPDFPFNSYDEILEAEKNKKIVLGASEDTARQWVSQGSTAPIKSRRYHNLLMRLHMIIYLGIILYIILSQNFILLLYIIPLIISFFFLRPISVRTFSLFKLIVWLGYGLIIWFIISSNSLWALYLGLSILIPWLLNKNLYNYCTKVVLAEAHKSEARFVELFRYNILGLRLEDGSVALGSDFLSKK